MARPRHSGFAGDITVNGKRYRASGFLTALAAEIWENQAKANILSGKPPPPSPSLAESPETWTLRQMFDYVQKEHWDHQGDPDYFRRTARQVCALFGEEYPAIDLVGAAGYERLEAACKALGNSGGTINRKASALSKALKFSIERGKIQGVLKPQFPRQKEGKGRERILSRAEEAERMAYLQQCLPDMADWFLLCIDTGARAYSEALHVYPHVDVRNGQLLIRGRSLAPNVVPIAQADRRVKTGENKSRTVGLTSRCLAMIERRKALVGPNEHLFSNTDLRRNTLIDNWQRMREHFGSNDPEDVPYSLRHTFGTRMILAGNTVPATRDAMGHTTERQTWKYVHLAGLLSKEAAVNLDRLLSSNDAKY